MVELDRFICACARDLSEVIHKSKRLRISKIVSLASYFKVLHSELVSKVATLAYLTCDEPIVCLGLEWL